MAHGEGIKARESRCLNKGALLSLVGNKFSVGLLGGGHLLGKWAHAGLRTKKQSQEVSCKIWFSLYSNGRWINRTRCSVFSPLAGRLVVGEWGDRGVIEKRGRARGYHYRVTCLWDEALSRLRSACCLCGVSQSLLRLCSSVHEPFVRVMSSTAISPLRPRPRSPFRIDQIFYTKFTNNMTCNFKTRLMPPTVTLKQRKWSHSLWSIFFITFNENR